MWSLDRGSERQHGRSSVHATLAHCTVADNSFASTTRRWLAASCGSRFRVARTRSRAKGASNVRSVGVTSPSMGVGKQRATPSRSHDTRYGCVATTSASKAPCRGQAWGSSRAFIPSPAQEHKRTEQRWCASVTCLVDIVLRQQSRESVQRDGVWKRVVDTKVGKRQSGPNRHSLARAAL